jgi:hypothetical protein
MNASPRKSDDTNSAPPLSSPRPAGAFASLDSGAKLVPWPYPVLEPDTLRFYAMKNFNYDSYLNPIEELMLNDLYDLYSDDLDDQLEVKAGSLEHLKVNLLNAIVDYMRLYSILKPKCH